MSILLDTAILSRWEVVVDDVHNMMNVQAAWINDLAYELDRDLAHELKKCCVDTRKFMVLGVEGMERKEVHTS